MIRSGARILCFSFFVASAFSEELEPDTPVPHAAELKRMIIAHIFDRPSDVNGDSILNFITGKASSVPDPEEEFRRLNVSVLDLDGMKKITKFAKEKYFEELIKQNENASIPDLPYSPKTRRLTELSGMHQAYYVTSPEVWNFVYQGIDWMQQAVYTTRYNLKRTKPLRKRYQNVYMFHLGTQYGMLMQLRIKIETLYETIRRMDKYFTKFHWFLMIYTRILQIHTDVTMTVKRMFELYTGFKKRRNDPVFMYSYTNPLDI